MTLSDATHRFEHHIDQVCEVTGLARKEAYMIALKHAKETSKRTGVDVGMVKSLAHDGLRQEGVL